jgi:hypothetical protein
MNLGYRMQCRGLPSVFLQSIRMHHQRMHVKLGNQLREQSIIEQV